MSIGDLAVGVIGGGLAGFWLAYARLSFRAMPWLAKKVDALNLREAKVNERMKEATRNEGRAMMAELEASQKQREIDRLTEELAQVKDVTNWQRLQWLAGQLSAHLTEPGVAAFALKSTSEVDRERQ